MTLRTYRAFTMTEALAAVKRDLGADAAILHTRSFRRGGIFGFGRRTVVEVTASRNDDREAQLSWMAQHRIVAGQRGAQLKPAVQSRPVPARTGPIDLLAAIEQHKREGGGSLGTAISGADSPPDAMLEGKNEAIRRNDFTSGASVETSEYAQASRTRVETIAPGDVHPRSISPVWVEQGQHETRGSPGEATVLPAVAQRFILMRVGDGSAPKSAPRPHAGRPREIANRVARSNAEAIQSPLLETLAQPVRMRATAEAPQKAAAHEEMRAIRDMVGQILQHQATARGAATPAMPPRIFELFLRLRSQEVAEEIAEFIAQRVQKSLAGQNLDDAAAVRGAMRTELMSLIPVMPTDLAAVPQDGRPLTIALLGPTGVGKTTTLAKLAATIKLHHGRRVAMITCDTYRIAAVEQLRTYANIISVPLQVALTPQEMVHACRQFGEAQVILIDTAGRSQRDRDKLGELSKFIQAAQPHEAHLVLSSTAGERVLAQEASSFSAVRCDRLIITKIDEAVSYGPVLNLLRQVGRPLSYITTGQEVPDHLEPAAAGRIAELILG